MEICAQTKREDLMAGQVSQGGTPINLSSSGAISLQPCTVIGYHVNTTGGGTIIFKDGGTSGTALNAAATPGTGFQAFPCAFKTSAFLTIAGTIDITVFVQQ
jgi:hypothetical protein